MRARRTTATAAAGILAAAGSAGLLGAGPAQAAPTRHYEVTITNLTSGQPFTPPLVAAHKGSVGVFDVGSAASPGVQEIAENGNLGPLSTALAADRAVGDVESASAPLVPAGVPGDGMFDQAVTLSLHAAPNARFLSWVSMLICTNDGFTGVDALKLPNQVGGTVSAKTDGYDAGTEVNTEDLADIVPPCQGLIGVPSPVGAPGTGTSDPSLAEGGVVHHHDGIAGSADLTQVAHGWDTSAPVAEITVTRVG